MVPDPFFLGLYAKMIVGTAPQRASNFCVKIQNAWTHLPGVAAELAWGLPKNQQNAEEVEDLWPARWYTQRLSPGRE
jgi:hypothetical protein